MKLALAILLLAPALFAAAATTGKTKSSSSHTKAKSTSHSSRSKVTHRSARSRRRARSTYQSQPTAERYKEIQQALAGKGYFKGEVSGKWGPDSSEALQRFQTDNKLPNDGKINSLSLIQLGLGPKRDPIQPVTTVPVAPVVPTSPSPGASSVSSPSTDTPPPASVAQP